MCWRGSRALQNSLWWTPGVVAKERPQEKVNLKSRGCGPVAPPPAPRPDLCTIRFFLQTQLQRWWSCRSSSDWLSPLVGKGVSLTPIHLFSKLTPEKTSFDYVKIQITFGFKVVHWRRKWQPTPVFLPGESQGRGSLVDCHLWSCTESDMTEVT